MITHLGKGNLGCRLHPATVYSRLVSLTVNLKKKNFLEARETNTDTHIIQYAETWHDQN